MSRYVSNDHRSEERGEGRAFGVTFVLAVALMALLNAARWIATRDAFQTDGMQQIGFPFVFFERGGISFRQSWDYPMLAANIGVAVLVAYVAAHLCRRGLRTAVHDLRTVGVQDDGTKNEASL